jgi:hypothetical protein
MNQSDVSAFVESYINESNGNIKLAYVKIILKVLDYEKS